MGENMDLRDYLAGQALQGLLAEYVPCDEGTTTAMWITSKHASKKTVEERFAIAAYLMADAMLGARIMKDAALKGEL